MNYKDAFDVWWAILCIIAGSVNYTFRGPPWVTLFCFIAGIFLLFAIVSTLGRV